MLIGQKIINQDRPSRALPNSKPGLEHLISYLGHNIRKNALVLQKTANRRWRSTGKAMAWLIVCQDIKTCPKTTINQLTVEPYVVEITMKNEHRPTLRGRLWQPKIVHHDFMITGIDVSLMVGHTRMLNPEIEAVITAVGHHFLRQFPRDGRIKSFEPFQQRVSVPIRNFYGIRFPVHVELNACHK